MNGLNTSNEDAVECPLCMEPLEVDDLNFYPCTCGYQICRFCWHRIRTDENKLCPACRKEYPENPADFTPLTQEEMIAFKSQKRQRDQQRKQKITENRKHLANVRVVQKNLVFVVGLPPRLADADILKKHEYFGKFGKIHKVVINPSTTYAGVQGPSASAYVTYVSNSDALRAIQSVNNIMIDGRLIKTSLGTTKYCSHFMKNQQCPKSDCMYLHELGDPDASFTKEEMHQGKHQEYEKRLHDALIASGGLNTNTSVTSSSNSGSTTATTTPTTIITNTTTTHNGVIASATTNGKPNSTSSESVNKLVTSSSSASLPIATPTASVVQQSKEAWPSLSVSPVGLSSSVGKETTARTASTTTNTSANNNTNNISKSSSGSSSSRKDKTKHEKTKNEKNSSKSVVKSSQNGLKTTTSNSKNNNNNNNNTNNSRTTEVVVVRSTPAPPTTTNTFDGEDQDLVKTKSDKMAVKEKSAQNQRTRANQLKDEQEDSPNKKELRSIRSSSNSSSSSGSTSSSRSESTSSNSNDSIAELSESSVASTSGKCSPGDECVVTTKSDKHLYANEVDNDNVNDEDDDVNVVEADVDDVDVEDEDDVEDAKKLGETTTINIVSENLLNKHAEDSTSITSSGGRSDSSSNYESTKSISNNSSDESLFSQTKGIMDAQATLAKLSLFDDNNSFFSSSSATALQQSLSLKNKYDALESRANTNSSQLPDLLSGIDGFQNSNASLNEWEEALKVLMLRNNRQIAEQLQFHQLQQQQQQQQHQQHLKQQQELQKRNNLLLNGVSSPINSTPNFDFPSYNNTETTDLSRLSQTALQQQQQLLHQHALQQTQLATDAYNPTFSNNSNGINHNNGSSNNGGNGLFELFNFHKNQQQQQQQIQNQQYLKLGMNGDNAFSDHLRMANLLENNRINQSYQYLADQPSLGLVQKQRMMGKMDQPQTPKSSSSTPQLSQNQQPTVITKAPVTANTQNRFAKQYTQQPNNVTTSDDDLGFDPFIETQKALAELIENEQSQSTTTTSTTTPLVAPIAVTNTKLMHQQLQPPLPPHHHNNHHHQQQHTTSMTQQHQQQQILDNLQRARMPPPGFNHMNAGGYGNNNNNTSNNYGMTRNSGQQNTSKLLPMVNMPGGGAGGLGLGNNLNTLQQTQQQQQQQLANSWGMPQLYQSQQQSQPQTLSEAQMHAAMSQNPNSSNHNKAFCNTDWTSMDPAILSYRQFSFPQMPPQPQPQQPLPQAQQQQQQHHPQPQSDLFMQHLNQQQQQQSGFNSQPQQYNSGLGMPGGLLNPQQNSQAPVNFSHSNWLNTEQSLFMNSLPNGFTANNFDKFSIPMPPGMHPNGLTKQQKAECIN